MSGETEVLISKINVRKLISVFESKAEPDNTNFTRPRARSLGNLLNNDVVVKYHDYNTLDDVKEALEQVQTSLNFYLVYDKQKHVNFQEQLFNILTGVIGIKTENDEDRKKLIAQTQSLVSFLNQKLPNTSKSITTNGTDELKDEVFDTVDSSNKVISVQKLRQNFLPKRPPQVDPPVQPSKTKTKHVEESNTGTTPTPPSTPTDAPSNDVPSKEVSVSKLRNLFEEKSKTFGLQAALDPPRTFQYEVKIPYTEGNLGKYRLYRTTSGHYLNYTGLLNNVDVNRKGSSDLTRSKSLHGLEDSKGYSTYRNDDSSRDVEDDGELSDEESSESSTESVESVKAAKASFAIAKQVFLGKEQTLTKTIGEESNKFQHAQVVTKKEDAVFSSSTTVEVQEIKSTSEISDTHSLNIEDAKGNETPDLDDDELERAIAYNRSGSVVDTPDNPNTGSYSAQEEEDTVHSCTPQVVETHQEVLTVKSEDEHVQTGYEKVKLDPSTAFIENEKIDSSILLEQNGFDTNGDDDQLENVDEEFEKLVQNNSIE